MGIFEDAVNLPPNTASEQERLSYIMSLNHLSGVVRLSDYYEASQQDIIDRAQQGSRTLRSFNDQQ